MLGGPGTLITNRRHYLKHLRPQPPSTTRAQPPASTTGAQPPSAKRAQSPSAKRACWKMLFQLYDPAPSIVFWCKIYSEAKVVFLNFLIWAYLNWKVVLDFISSNGKRFCGISQRALTTTRGTIDQLIEVDVDYSRTGSGFTYSLSTPDNSRFHLELVLYIGQNISTPKI